MMWGYPEGFGWWMVFGGMWMIVFWAVVIGAIVWGVSRIAGGRKPSAGENDDPVEIARKRFAKGEITKDEFENIRETLETHP